MLDESGLSFALNWYMEGLMERSGIAITLEIAEGFERLPSDIELAIFSAGAGISNKYSPPLRQQDSYHPGSS